MPRIRTSHSPYLSLGINHTLTLQDIMCRGLFAVLYLH